MIYMYRQIILDGSYIYIVEFWLIFYIAAELNQAIRTLKIRQ